MLRLTKRDKPDNHVLRIENFGIELRKSVKHLGVSVTLENIILSN